MNGFYKDYSDFLAEHFPGKMQKLAINAGLSCPNRDGTIGCGGCCYCVNSSFVPNYCDPADSVTTQIDKGIQFFGKKYPAMRYLAYFQAYTNTNAGIDHLINIYDEALRHPRVDGIIIGTRPDCMPPSLLSILGEWHRGGRWVMIEYGAETHRDDTLTRINRCHTWGDVVNAVQRTHHEGIPIGLHLIAGLPGESLDDIIASVDAATSLPIDTIKVHQLQVLRGSRLATDIATGHELVPQFTLEQYIEVCAEIVRRTPPHIAIDRFLASAPQSMVISPHWGLKNYQFAHKLHRRLSNS